MKVGSLFSGIGGIELGFEKQGFETEWFVECESYAQAVLRARFPGAKIYGDITQIDFTAVPEVDILTGGFPCQDISNAGRRAGITGSRSSLWGHYARAISEIRPKYALIENVSALTRRGLEVVLADLAQIGYDAEWHCISASSVGALHKRDRIFIIAYPNGERQQEQRQSKSDEEKFKSPECCGKTLAHSSSDGCKGRCQDAGSVESSRKEGRVFELARRSPPKNVSNSKSVRLDGRLCPNEEELPGVHIQKQVRSDQGREASGRNTLRGEETTWAVESDVHRVVDGVPNRVDRIKCLGNAVVPQVAEVFAKAIKEVENEKEDN